MMQTYLTQFAARATQCLRGFMLLGWPNQLACVLLVVAVAASASAWVLDRHVQDLSTRLAALQANPMTAPASMAPVYEPLSMAPQNAQYMQDLGRLFQLGKEAGVTFGVIEYKSEANTKTPLTVRTIDLRATEDYPIIKGFISKVLNDMPHAALQEIRIERKDAQTAQGAMLIKLSLVYQTRH